mmetsp:Transcript_50624/g.94318  ORF Transcript_50624/g.94318 Transcript_50624/m.94318 type:complete len:199 (-) Transcript_50624:196-792(-)
MGPIEKRLRDYPKYIREYMETAEQRVGCNSSDRFSAIMQIMSGSICFTSTSVYILKLYCLKVMSATMEFVGKPVLQQLNVGQHDVNEFDVREQDVGGGSCAHILDRILVGEPCVGEKGTKLITLHILEPESTINGCYHFVTGWWKTYGDYPQMLPVKIHLSATDDEGVFRLISICLIKIPRELSVDQPDTNNHLRVFV